MEKILNFIDGKDFGASKNFLQNITPINKEVTHQVINSEDEDIDHAVDAALRAFPEWSKKTIEERSHYLDIIGDLILENLEELSHAETIDSGKPISLSSKVDIPRSAKNFKYFAALGKTLSSSFYNRSSSTLTFDFVEKRPLGVVATISPWNLPLYLLTWKIAPALLMGNTIIAKPSEITPVTAHLLKNIILKSGLPKGVLNIVFGDANTGRKIIKHINVKAISFTGSTRAGKEILKEASSQGKKVALEMGGKNAAVVFSESHLQKTVEQIVKSSFTNQGQICLCTSRIFVEENMMEQFSNLFKEQVQKLKIGDPLKPSTNLGAVVSADHYKKIESYKEYIKDQKIPLLVEGDTVIKTGFFHSPWVTLDSDENSRINQEEIFGPLTNISSFTNHEGLIKKVNATEYGLVTSIYHKNIGSALSLAREIESGMIWINSWMDRNLNLPFGGVKNSGHGSSEGGEYILDFFTKNISYTVNFEETK